MARQSVSKIRLFVEQHEGENFWVGIDVHKVNYHVCLYSAGGDYLNSLLRLHAILPSAVPFETSAQIRFTIFLLAESENSFQFFPGIKKSGSPQKLPR